MLSSANHFFSSSLQQRNGTFGHVERRRNLFGRRCATSEPKLRKFYNRRQFRAAGGLPFNETDLSPHDNEIHLVNRKDGVQL